jgi:hypothetical protein
MMQDQKYQYEYLCGNDKPPRETLTYAQLHGIFAVHQGGDFFKAFGAIRELEATGSMLLRYPSDGSRIRLWATPIADNL